MGNPSKIQNTFLIQEDEQKIVLSNNLTENKYCCENDTVLLVTLRT